MLESCMVTCKENQDNYDTETWQAHEYQPLWYNNRIIGVLYS